MSEKSLSEQFSEYFNGNHTLVESAALATELLENADAEISILKSEIERQKELYISAIQGRKDMRNGLRKWRDETKILKGVISTAKDEAIAINEYGVLDNLIQILTVENNE